MGETFHLKAGDTSPNLRATLRGTNGDPVDLTSSSVTIHVSQPRGGDTIVDEPVDTVDPDGGVIQYNWSSGDLTEAGIYRLEFVVTFPNGDTETFPNEGFHDLQITQ